MITGIIARGFALTTALRAFVERRLGAALRRHAVAAHRVSARLADVNGPRGGIDKSCVIEVRGPALQPVVVRERDADLYAAIDRAAARLDRTLARRVGRRRRARRADLP